IVVSGKDEISDLASEFNAMAGRLRQYRKSSLGELLQAQQAAQAAIDSLCDPVIIFDLSGNIMNINRAAEEQLKISTESDTQNPLKNLSEEFKHVVERIQRAVLSGKGPYLFKGVEEAVSLHTSHGEKYYLPSATPLLNEEGQTIGTTMVFQDVTKLRRY